MLIAVPKVIVSHGVVVFIAMPGYVFHGVVVFIAMPEVTVFPWCGYIHTRVLQKFLSLGSDYLSATFYQTFFYYKPSKYSPFTETHFCNLFTQSRKADE